MSSEENEAPSVSGGSHSQHADADAADDDGDAVGIPSPLVSTKDRKKMILERRRREREAEGNQQAPSHQQQQRLKRTGSWLSSSSSWLPGNKRPRPRSRPSSSLENNSNSQMKASLWSDNTQLSSSSASFGNSATGSQEAGASFSFLRRRSRSDNSLSSSNTMQSYSNEQSITPKASGRSRSSSLFGAVMQRASIGLPPNTSTWTTLKETATPLASTPTKLPQQQQPSPLPLPQSVTTPNHPQQQTASRMCEASSTPLSSSYTSSSLSSSALKASRASPGGFGLWKLIRSVTSPLHLRHIHKTLHDQDDDNDNDSIASPESKETPADDWRVTDMDLKDGHLGTIDWSIKRKLRIECHPGTCLPGSSSSVTAPDQNAEQEGMHLFMMGGTAGINGVSSASRWEAARLFWQHPASEDPFLSQPQLLLQDETSEEKSSTLSFLSSSSLRSLTKEASIGHPNVAAQMIQDVRGRDAPLHRLLRSGHSSTSHSSSLLWIQKRQREWQEAFRSLYFTWCARVEELQKGGDRPLPRQLLQTCFYMISSTQVVLFRIGMKQKEDDVTEEVATSLDVPRLVPMVVLSSTSPKLRAKLRSMGVVLYLRNKNEKQDVFEESMLETTASNSKLSEEEPDSVRDELEALRRAQAHGETAGADVSVSMRRKRNKQNSTPQKVQPLYLLGHDDCAALFELYLNTIGKPDGSSSWRTGDGNVPLLLCRGLGHFVHASLKSLPITSRRCDAQRSQQNDSQASLELRGHILPCAVQDLLCAAATRMVEDTTNNHDGLESASISLNEEQDELGSHFFVLQATTYDGGKETPRLEEKCTGTGGSHWLHRVQSVHPLEGESYVGVVNMAVWDIARAQVVAYKEEHVSLLNK